MSLETPILFCIYNRPELTAQVFSAIAQQRPKRLLIAADGPKPEKPGDGERVRATRQIVERVDWPCDVETDFSFENLGCKSRMSSGIDWAFQRSERLIILEDDCLPTPEFFPFCETLLERYSDDDRVMMISGDNFQQEPRGDASYYFSKWSHIWGWASWRRAWALYDVEMKTWPQVRQQELLRAVCENDFEFEHWKKTFDQQYAGKIDTWDYAWAYSCWTNNGLTILPQKNLVSNLGFGPDATHTTDTASPLQRLPVGQLGTLSHPTVMARNQLADLDTLNRYFLPQPPQRRKNRLRQWIQRVKRAA